MNLDDRAAIENEGKTAVAGVDRSVTHSEDAIPGCFHYRIIRQKKGKRAPAPDVLFPCSDLSTVKDIFSANMGLALPVASD